MKRPKSVVKVTQLRTAMKSLGTVESRVCRLSCKKSHPCKFLSGYVTALKDVDYFLQILAGEL